MINKQVAMSRGEIAVHTVPKSVEQCGLFPCSAMSKSLSESNLAPHCFGSNALKFGINIYIC